MSDVRGQAVRSARLIVDSFTSWLVCRAVKQSKGLPSEAINFAGPEMARASVGLLQIVRHAVFGLADTSWKCILWNNS